MHFQPLIGQTDPGTHTQARSDRRLRSRPGLIPDRGLAGNVLEGTHPRKSDRLVRLLPVWLGLMLLPGSAWGGVLYSPCAASPPRPSREFRAAWVATVDNIDWPSAPGLTTAQQKAELVAIMDRAATLRLNAVIFQVRPACDALYASKIEPWSDYLTGVMGKAPQPYYDPLGLAIELAHQRGLELHAWFNPYRAHHPSSKSPLASTHIGRTRPQLVRQYGRSLWLDPGEKQVQDYSLSVVMDVVKRYDIDGVHFDDYFYPYKEQDAAHRELDFPDEPSWRKYGAGRGLDREDWRRENVNVFIQRVYKSVKTAKPWVKFGISPFGIWRPGSPAQVTGYDAYAKLYADSRKWLAEGWLDYFAPQLYWSIDSPGQSYPVLLKWWAEQNPKNRHLWPGLNTYNGGRRWKAEEIVNQVRLTRRQPGASGHIHWDMKKGLMSGNGVGETLSRGVYSEPALVPASPWLSRTTPGAPKLSVRLSENRLRATWRSGGGKAWLWLLQTRVGGAWTTEILPADQTTWVSRGGTPEVIALSAVDRTGNLGPATALQQQSR